MILYSVFAVIFSKVFSFAILSNVILFCCVTLLHKIASVLWIKTFYMRKLISLALEEKKTKQKLISWCEN